jgi:hypothetical protein
LSKNHQSTPSSPAAIPQLSIGKTPKKQNKTRKKSAFKLRFHHQALPPEYLDHYEATQNILQQKEAVQNRKNNKQMEANSDKTSESVRNWLKKISDLQKEGISLAPIKDEVELLEGNTSAGPATTAGGKPSKVINYKDLPYMGEMTLENSKPRRGRKPKKADICHLIYKNYGTIFPGTPKGLMEGGVDKSSNVLLPAKAEVDSKLLSSLLEKRLVKETPIEKMDIANEKLLAEPLNLCLRDLGGSESLLLSSSDDETSDHLFDSSRSTPLILPADLITDTALADNLKMALPNFQSALMDTSPSPDTPSTPGSDAKNDYVYWPGGGVFIHPMALYYQKMVDATGAPLIPPASTSAPPLRSPPSPAPSPSSQKREPSQRVIVPKTISQLMKPPTPSSPPGLSSETSSTTSSKQTTPVPTKRKRSAIFIPPVTQESSNNNSATEVSICKFKFTGGAKPSLQEKKMLSVDSGGNFRYYSGTGDKSMRGYEFFPRESLQQSSLTSGSTAGAFLNASGEKIPCAIPPSAAALSGELLQIPEYPIPGGSVKSPIYDMSTLPPDGARGSDKTLSASRKKRKSRRSQQRENLEKTFKEKGFLIQTQQLQSAEGATYCKFRQLRKFTRYLFRSWKDYLPGELQQAQAQAQAQGLVGPIPEGMELSPEMLSMGKPCASGSNKTG